MGTSPTTRDLMVAAFRWHLQNNHPVFHPTLSLSLGFTKRHAPDVGHKDGGPGRDFPRRRTGAPSETTLPCTKVLSLSHLVEEKGRQTPLKMVT